MFLIISRNAPNDYKGIWHDIYGMCITVGKDISPTERLFTVIIRGVGQRRYWKMKSILKRDHTGNPYLSIMLADEPDTEKLFELGRVVMTPGVSALDADVAPFLARHENDDWGASLDSHDKQQNNTAVKEGCRIVSVYNVPIRDGETERIWIISEAVRSVTTILLPREYGLLLKNGTIG